MQTEDVNQLTVLTEEEEEKESLDQLGEAESPEVKPG